MISVKLTFFGLCDEAIKFYRECFNSKLIACKRFQDAKEAFPQEIDSEYHRFILSAELEITLEDDKFYMTMGDSPTIIFTGINELSGCNDNIAFDIRIKNPELIRNLYEKFINAGSKTNIPLEQSEHRLLQCSVIDPYGICWTMFCDSKEKIFK